MGNVIVESMLKSNNNRIILNNYIENDPLSEENLDKTLKMVNEMRLLMPDKTIWLYSGYCWEHVFDNGWHYHPLTAEKLLTHRWERQKVLLLCDVMVDGQYIGSQKDSTLRFKGSKNQRIIDVQKSLKQNKIVLWESQ